MTAGQAVELLGELRPRTAIPVHYEGWKHFREQRDAIEPVFAAGAAAGARLDPLVADRTRRERRRLRRSVA